MRTIPGILLTLCSLAAGQTYDQFEVASVKPSAPGQIGGKIAGGPGSSDPGLFTCENIHLKNLVIIAYNLPEYRYSGPDWMRSARFNISATIPGGTTREQFRTMLQNLLAQRFQLKIHWEKKEMQTYELTVAKNGHKLKVSPQAAAGLDENSAGPPKTDSEGFPILPPGRRQTLLETGDGHIALRWADETMDQFATYLAAQLHGPVHNATSLPGKYDFTMRWLSDRQAAIDDSAPNLFSAVQEQLGLRLESKKSPIEILVVDHLEKIPTDN